MSEVPQPGAVPKRRRLSQRRCAIASECDVGAVRYRFQVGFFNDGSIGEIFLNGPKVGSAAQIAAHDAAIAASLALQFGCPLETLRHALLKLPTGESAGPLCRALDLATDP